MRLLKTYGRLTESDVEFSVCFESFLWSSPCATCSLMSRSFCVRRYKSPQAPLVTSAIFTHVSENQSHFTRLTHTILLAAMSVTKLNKVSGLEPENQTLEEHQGPSKTLKETMEIAVSNTSVIEKHSFTQLTLSP